MKATSKEVQCIDFSLEIRLAVIQRKISEFEERNKLPLIFLTPKAFERKFGITSNIGLAYWKSGIIIIVTFLFYFLLVPIFFFVGLYELLFNGRKNKEQSPEIQLKEIYSLDQNVSEIKTFSQLWDDKGLRDYGREWWKYSGYTKEEQRRCIYKWFEILYNRDSSVLDNLVSIIEEEQTASIRRMYADNPGLRISMDSMESILPERIDTLFGEYK
jgi:hypothetical protein